MTEPHQPPPAPTKLAQRKVRPSPGADVAAASTIQSRCRCGSGERSPGADVAAVSAVPMRACGDECALIPER